MEKIWLNSYQQGIPNEINPDTYASIVEIFEESMAKFANRPAFRNLSHTITYRQLDRYSRYCAGYFQHYLHLKKGERLAIMLPNILQYPVVLLGALRAGLVVVNVNPLYTASEIIYQLNDANVQTIVVLANFAHTIEQALVDVTLKNIVITEIADLLPLPKRLLINFTVKYIKRMLPRYRLPGAIKFRQLLTLGEKLPHDNVPLTGNDIAFLQYTGGTTGIAKGAILTHRNMIANIEQVKAWINPIIKPDKEVIITPLPLYHIFALLANLLVFTNVGALNVLITNPRDITGFIKTIRKEKFTAIIGVNTLFNALLRHKNFLQLDFSNLTLALGGGMSLQRVVAQKWQKITLRPLIEGYGLTETSPVVCISPMHLSGYNGSVGLPVPSTMIKIIDEQDNELAIGEVGELCVKGPQVMAGYWQQPQETTKVLSADGWVKTGDLARIDNKGFVYIVDRKKDMIIVSGFNVYPNEIEAVLARHPGVKEVAVIGVPYEQSGEAVKAFIVKADPTLNQQLVKDHCLEHLTAYKRPKFIEFVEQLPKSNVGKILRRELKP